MENKKDYKKVVRELDYLTAIKKEYDALISCGIPVGKAHFFDLPYEVNSGYSMGETIDIYCNDKKVLTRDNKQEYAKSCKWRATHGYLRIVFTKKALRKYIDMWAEIKEINRCLTYNQPSELREQRFSRCNTLISEVKSFLWERVDRKVSRISANKKV